MNRVDESGRIHCFWMQPYRLRVVYCNLSRVRVAVSSVTNRVPPDPVCSVRSITRRRCCAETRRLLPDEGWICDPVRLVLLATLLKRGPARSRRLRSLSSLPARKAPPRGAILSVSRKAVCAGVAFAPQKAERSLHDVAQGRWRPRRRPIGGVFCPMESNSSA